jgi:hypothetical protein
LSAVIAPKLVAGHEVGPNFSIADVVFHEILQT